MFRAGLLDDLHERVNSAGGLRVVHVVLAGVDPTVAAAEEASGHVRDAGARVVLAVGGGSAMSLAKAVAIRLRNASRIDTYATAAITQPPAPCLAIPTTAGSGSEVSNALVLYDPASSENVGMRARGVEPDIALLDGELLAGLPRAPMLDAAADALSHAFEALWARGSTGFTDTLALAAIRQIRAVLPRALRTREPADLQVMLQASTMANLACGNAGLGLVHALSSATAVRVPHGKQNSVLLPHVAAFNRPVVSAEARAEIDALDSLYDAVGLEPFWPSAELPPDADELMITAALASPFHRNNQRTSTPDQLRQLVAATHPQPHTSPRSTP